MNLEQQVVSLPLAKRLKELGVKQESLWYWHEDTDGEYVGEMMKARTPDEPFLLASAYSVAELGEIMKSEFQIFTNFVHEEGDWVCVVKKWIEKPLANLPKMQDYLFTCNADTEADARAKALIWLIENNHLEV